MQSKRFIHAEGDYSLMEFIEGNNTFYLLHKYEIPIHFGFALDELTEKVIFENDPRIISFLKKAVELEFKNTSPKKNLGGCIITIQNV